jgi:hypothetical protein
MLFDMTRTLQKAIAMVADLPKTDQEQIGRELVAHVRKLQKLRADLKMGIRSLDAGEGRPLGIEDFLKRARKRNAKG